MESAWFIARRTGRGVGSIVSIGYLAEPQLKALLFKGGNYMLELISRHFGQGGSASIEDLSHVASRIYKMVDRINRKWLKIRAGITSFPLVQ